MDAVLEGLAWDICIPYLDDIGVWSTGVSRPDSSPEQAHAEACADSFEQMMNRMDTVLERVKWAGLSCKASKCVLFATETDYLGHVIGREGLKMDPKKISAVANIDAKSINTLERVRSFLGLCSYYRRFIASFSKIAACLTDLTKKGVDVATLSQSEECQAAIEKLKTAITSEPVLAAPRFDRRFIVKTDGAQTEGIGGVLSQLDDERHERVNAYYGRRLQNAERNYTITEIELLAALSSIKNWRPYLWGRKFLLIVDHVALKWLHSIRETIEGGPASRLMRWILKLAEYNFEVEHKAGVLHCDADGVSRLVAAAYKYEQADEERMEARRAESPTESGKNSVVAPVIPPATKKRMRIPTVTARRIQDQDRTDRLKGAGHSAVQTSYLPKAISREVLSKAQATDSSCQHLMTWMQDKELPAVTNRASLWHSRWVVRQAKHLRVDTEGMLMHVQPDNQLELPYIPTEMREIIMAAFHYSLGHGSEKRVADLLRTRYYWPGMIRDVKEHVAECHECTLAKPPTRRARTSRRPRIGSYPFDLLFCDIVDMDQTHDYTPEGAGYDKLIVFVDSLSRWVEAVPCHGSPSSETVLDAFLTQVVCRHGAPRELRSDRGSNLVSQLNRAIYDQTGVSLCASTSEHHEALGTVERFQQTLIRMTRTADEGGQYWVSHLPFLLMSYHATKHRATRRSPAEILFGRELRLPAQLGSDALWPAVTVDGNRKDQSLAATPLPPDVKAYALRMQTYMQEAWAAAHTASIEAQERNVSDTAHPSIHAPAYQVGDRVCRLLPDRKNKLKYLYSGPYRVAEVVSKGRMRLRDLENNILHDEFDVADLRPYRTKIDEEDLHPDEYLVDRIMAHRDVRGTREYRIKWRGYGTTASTWEPKTAMMKRCAETVTQYELAHQRPTDLPSYYIRLSPMRSPPGPTLPTVVARLPDQYESELLPSISRFARGQWTYGRRVATPRGQRLQWFPSKQYTQEELSSDHFKTLRETTTHEQVLVAALTEWEIEESLLFRSPPVTELLST